MSAHHLLDHPTSKHIKVLFTDRAHTWIPRPLKCTQGTNGDQRGSGAIEQICQRWPQSLPQMEDGIVVWFWVLLVSERTFYLLTITPPPNPHLPQVSAQAGPFSSNKWEKKPIPHISCWWKMKKNGCFWIHQYTSLSPYYISEQGDSFLCSHSTCKFILRPLFIFHCSLSC